MANEKNIGVARSGEGSLFSPSGINIQLPLPVQHRRTVYSPEQRTMLAQGPHDPSSSGGMSGSGSPAEPLQGEGAAPASPSGGGGNKGPILPVDGGATPGDHEPEKPQIPQDLPSRI